MRILFAGTPASAATVLEGLLTSGHEVVAVLTREDAPSGRKKILTPSPVAELALARGINLIKANKVDQHVLDEIALNKVDLAIVVAYGVILREDALRSIAGGWFNVHFSILPRWRGAAPVQRALQHGDTETGVTLFKIDTGLDTGPIVSTVPTLIQPDENAGELLARLSQLSTTLLNAELPKIYGSSHDLSNQVGEITLAPKTAREEARIDFSSDALKISHLVRAMNPEPMSWCDFNDEPMRVLRARDLAGHVSNGEIGEVSLVSDKVIVACGNGTSLELLEVQPASRSVMSAKDWLNGQPGAVTLK
jgi:methionyl-tRNA formyltransferase